MYPESSPHFEEWFTEEQSLYERGLDLSHADPGELHDDRDFQLAFFLGFYESDVSSNLRSLARDEVFEILGVEDFDNDWWFDWREMMGYN